MRSVINLGAYARPAPPRGEPVKAQSSRRARATPFVSFRDAAPVGPPMIVPSAPAGPQPQPFPEAPLDGQAYARKDAGWTDAGFGGVEEAPGDGLSYMRAGGAWTSGGEVAGTLTVNDALTVFGPAELAAQTVRQAGSNLHIDRALGENCNLVMSGSIGWLTISNWPPAGVTGKVRLIITNGGPFTITGWPINTLWPGGTPPSITPVPGRRDIILLMTDDGGTTVFGSVVGQNYR
jgi:hypothetical protein